MARSTASSGLSELERVFDRIAGGRSVRVEYLELDLGELRGSDWLAEFVQRLVACAESTLTQAAGGPARTPQAEANERRRWLNTP